MDAKEANMIIAKYMGWCDSHDFHIARKMQPFSTSLDNLVSVWARLQEKGWNICIETDYTDSVEWEVCVCGQTVLRESIVEAAAIATARAILSLDKTS